MKIKWFPEEEEEEVKWQVERQIFFLLLKLLSLSYLDSLLFYHSKPRDAPDLLESSKKSENLSKLYVCLRINE